MTQIENRLKLRSLRLHRDARKAHASRTKIIQYNHSPDANRKLAQQLFYARTTKEEAKEIAKNRDELYKEHGIVPLHKRSKEEKDRRFAINMGKIGHKKPVSLAMTKHQPAYINEREDARVRLIFRVRKAKDSIVEGVREVLSSPGPEQNSQSTRNMIDLVCKMAKLVGDPIPEFYALRQPGMKATIRNCINCGCELPKHWMADVEVCEDCA